MSLANVAQAVFLSPVPGVQIVESGEGKKKRRCGEGGRGGERESERSKREEEGRTRSLIPLRLSRDRGGYTSQFEVSPEGGEVLNKKFFTESLSSGIPEVHALTYLYTSQPFFGCHATFLQRCVAIA